MKNLTFKIFPSFKIIFERRLQIFQSNISTKVWGNQWGSEFGRELKVALLVWVNLSWTGKTAQKLIIKKPLSSSCLPQVSDSFHLKAFFKFPLVEAFCSFIFIWNNAVSFVSPLCFPIPGVKYSSFYVRNFKLFLDEAQFLEDPYKFVVFSATMGFPNFICMR